MTNYIITEEELSIYLRLSAVRQKGTNLTFKEMATDFLKAKEPVELFTEDYKLQQKAINTLNDSGLKLMEENKELKGELDTYRKILDKWNGVAKLFDDEINWGEWKCYKTLELVRDLKDKYEMLQNRYDLLDEDRLELKQENIDFKSKLANYKKEATSQK